MTEASIESEVRSKIEFDCGVGTPHLPVFSRIEVGERRRLVEVGLVSLKVVAILESRNRLMFIKKSLSNSRLTDDPFSPRLVKVWEDQSVVRLRRCIVL